MNKHVEISPGLLIQGFEAPLKLKDFKLIAFDMDSTLINIECIDEVAEVAGKKAEVAAITEAAMRGEISDYKESLRQRVALLKGIPADSLDHVYEHKLSLNPGAQLLVQKCQQAGLKTLLVSGGFTFFTDRVKELLNIDFSRSNIFEIQNNVLTGKMVSQSWGDICDGEEKKRMLLQTCAQLGITPHESIAMGDGANDLPMMNVSGLSVAYHAKPSVKEQAQVVIESGGLDRLLEVMI